MLDVVYFSDETWFMVSKWWLHEQSEVQNLVQWTAIHITWKILISTKNWCMVCLAPSSTRPQLTVRYKQTSQPTSSRCSKRMKSLLASRWLHMLYLSKNNGFLEREFWQAIHFYRFVAPPCHQTGHQFLSLRLTKRTRQDRLTQAWWIWGKPQISQFTDVLLAWWIWGKHQTSNFSVYRCTVSMMNMRQTSNLKFLSLQMYC